MKTTKIDEYRVRIAALSCVDQFSLRQRASDPESCYDTAPFFSNKLSGGRILISYRPDRNTKQNLGSPEVVLQILDELDVQVDPPQSSRRVPIGIAVVLLAVLSVVTIVQSARFNAAGQIRSAANNTISKATTKVCLPPIPAARQAAATQPSMATDLKSGKSTSNSVNQAPCLLPQTNKPAAATILPREKTVAAVFAAIKQACGNNAKDSAVTENLDLVADILLQSPTENPVLVRSSRIGGVGLSWPASSVYNTSKENLHAVSYQEGILVLWVRDRHELAKGFSTGAQVWTSMAGWTEAGWDFTILVDRIEIREAQK